jgi:hypothetical protein
MPSKRHQRALVHRTGKAGQAADLRRPGPRQFIGARAQVRDHRAERGDPLGRRRVGPGAIVERGPRSRHGRVHVGLVSLGHLRHHLLGIGRRHGDQAAAVRGHPSAADEEVFGVGDMNALGKQHRHILLRSIRQAAAAARHIRPFRCGRGAWCRK